MKLLLWVNLHNRFIAYLQINFILYISSFIIYFNLKASLEFPVKILFFNLLVYLLKNTMGRIYYIPVLAITDITPNYCFIYLLTTKAQKSHILQFSVTVSMQHESFHQKSLLPVFWHCHLKVLLLLLLLLYDLLSFYLSLFTYT